jgi:hypothetical protein
MSMTMVAYSLVEQDLTVVKGSRRPRGSRPRAPRRVTVISLDDTGRSLQANDIVMPQRLF